MKTTIIVLRVFLGLIGLALIFQGFMWSFLPESNLEMNGIQISSILGINMVKSDIGGGLLAAGTFLGLFSLKGKHWFYPSVIIASAYFLVRAISLITDGYHETVVIGVILEGFVIVAALILNMFWNAGLNEKV